MTEKFLKTKEVCSMLGITRPTLQKWMKLGKFPRSVALSERTVAFRAWPGFSSGRAGLGPRAPFPLSRWGLWFSAT